MNSVTRHDGENLENLGKNPLKIMGSFPEFEVLSPDLEQLRQRYTDALFENAQLKRQNRRLREVILAAGLEVPLSAGLDDQESERLSVQTSGGVIVESRQAEDQTELERQREQIANLEENRRRDLARWMDQEAEKDWHHRLMSVDNQIVPATWRMVLLAVRAYLRSLWDLGQIQGQFIDLPIWQIARNTGLSTDTVGKAVKGLHTLGLLERQAHTPKAENGVTHTTVSVALTLLFYNPESIPASAPKRGHGGDRLCKHCGSNKLVRRVQIICKACHLPQGEAEETPVNHPDPVEEALNEVEEEKRQRRALEGTPQDAACSDDETLESLDAQGSSSLDVQASESVPQSAEVPGYRLPAIFQTPKPIGVACALCVRDKDITVTSWSWSNDDHEYCCASCYSPFSWHEREIARQAEEKEKGGSEWTPF